MFPDALSARQRRLLEVVVAASLILALSVGVSAELLDATGVIATPFDALAKHVAAALNFREAFLAGQWLPRLQLSPPDLPDIPLFQYHGFLSAAAAQPFLALGMSGARAVILGLVATRFIGLTALYLAARQAKASPISSFLGAAAYALTPYCVSTLYGSVDVPQAAAQGILPLLILGWTCVLGGKRRAGFYVTAIGIVLLALADPAYLLFGVALLAALVAFAATWADRLTLAGGLLAGMLASAFQWCPALLTSGKLALQFLYPLSFEERNLSDFSGWFGIPSPIERTYYLTLGFWTLPAFAGLICCTAVRARRFVAIPLLVSLTTFLFLAYCPIAFWRILPTQLALAEGPYPPLAFAAVLCAIAIPLIIPDVKWPVAAVLLLLMVDSQLAVLTEAGPGGNGFHEVVPLSDQDIRSRYATTDYRTLGPLVDLSGGWLTSESRLRLDQAPSPGVLELVGSSGVPDGPVDIWLADAKTNDPIGGKIAVGPGGFRVFVPLPATERPLILRVSRTFVPSELNPLSSDHRRLSVNVTSARILSQETPGDLQRPLAIPRSLVMRREAGAYKRLYSVSTAAVATGKPDSWYEIELPQAYSAFTRVIQGGEHPLTGVGPLGHLVVLSKRPAVPIKTVYELPLAVAAATIFGWLLLALAAFPQAGRAASAFAVRLQFGRLSGTPRSWNGARSLGSSSEVQASISRTFHRFVSAIRPADVARAEKWVAPLFCLAAIAIVIGLLCDYGLNWTHPEIYEHRSSHPLNYATFHWRDLARFFDCRMVDSCGRPRLSSFLMFYLDSVFRVWLIQYLPPHPSLSLTWILSAASLYFFYRAILDLTDDRTAALIAGGLYALSGGVLSSVLMLFNSAKPLAGFFVNLCLFLAARLWRSGDNRPYSATAIILFASMFLAYCSDETAWALYGAIPFLFPGLISRRHLGLSICFLATFPLFLAFATWVVPAATEYFWGYQQGIGFWGYALNIDRHTYPGSLSFFERFTASSLLATASSLVLSAFSWPRSNPIAAALSLQLIAAGLVTAVALGKGNLRLRLVRSMGFLVLFIIYQGLLMQRLGDQYAGATLNGLFYYGALFSNFSLVVLALAMSCFRNLPTARIACVLAAIFIGYVSLSNAMSSNRQWMDAGDSIYTSLRIPGPHTDLTKLYHGPFMPVAPLTEAKTAAYWRAAKTGNDLRSLRSSFSAKDAWLFEEVDAWFCSRRACCASPHRITAN